MAQQNFDGDEDDGAVYTMSNATTGNQVLAFKRDRHGTLTSAGAVATYGFGVGGGVDALGSQHSLILSADNQWLLVANAGSNDISVMRADDGGLKFVGKTGSGGNRPTSIAVSNDLVYVLNGGPVPNITGFRLRHDGHLMPIPNSTRALSGAAFGEVSFDALGESLLVTDKGNSNIILFGINEQGLPSAQPVVNPSNGAVPFGMTFDRHDHLLVVEAGVDAVSSYSIEPNDMLKTISGSVMNGQTAACWIASSGNQFVFTTNPGTHSVSSYRLDARTGILTLIMGVAASGNTPLDVATSRHGHYVYALDVGNLGIDMFHVEQDGSLTNLGSVAGGLQTYSQGIAVR
jgi:6-phosphogluconolactonase (cycloisomerase 2 family)